MRFIEMLFKDLKEYSSMTKYKYEISSAFYDVYCNDDDIYHAAIEDKESIKSRLHFYDKYFKRENYPIYSSEVCLSEQEKRLEVLHQVTGLPFCVIARQTKLGLVEKTSEEIINDLVFEEGIKPFYGDLPKSEDESFLEGDSYSLVGCFNYLISKGLYLQNLDRIIDPFMDNEYYYPIKINPEKLPEEISGHESGDKLFFDFCEIPSLFNPKAYKETFATVDSMTLEEICDLAFKPLSDIKEEYQTEFRLSLRRYIFGIARYLINEFYRKEYKVPNIVSKTVLEENPHLVGNDGLYIYSGQNFPLVALNRREIVEEDGKLVLKTVRNEYQLPKQFLAKVSLAYTTVHKAMERDNSYSYMPQIFLKLMGLPYPAYKYFEFFDFEKGTEKEFKKLLPRVDMRITCVYPLVFNSGLMKYLEDYNESNGKFLKLSRLDNVFCSECQIAEAETEYDFLFSLKGAERNSLGLFDSKTDFIDSIVADIDKDLNVDHKLALPDKEIIDEFFKKDKDGFYVNVYNLFDLLSKGYSFKEACHNLLEYREDDLVDDVFSLFSLIVFKLLEKKNWFAEYNLDSYTNYHNYSEDVIHDHVANKVYHITNHYDYSYELKTFHYKRIVSLQNEEIINTLSKIYDKYRLNNFSSPFTASIDHQKRAPRFWRGYDFYIRQDSYDIYDPYDLIFDDSESIFDKEEYRDLILNDDHLRRTYQYREAIKDGILLTDNDNVNCRMFCLPEMMNDKAKAYLSADAIQVLYEGYIERVLTSENPDEGHVYKIEASNFRRLVREYLSGYSLNNYSDNPDVDNFINFYFKSFLTAYSNTLIGNKEYFVHSYWHTFKDGKKLSVMPGAIFSLFSFDGESYFLRKEDEDRILKLYKGATNSFQFQTTKRGKICKIVYDLGLPLPMSETAVKMLTENKNIDKDILEQYFKFEDIDIDEMELPVYDSFMHLNNSQFNRIIFSDEFNKSLIDEGYIYFSDTQLLFGDDNYDNYINDKITRGPTLSGNHRVYLDEKLSGDVRFYLRPDAVTFSLLLDQFTEVLKNHHIMNEFIFIIREQLNYLYHTDNEIIIKAIKMTQTADNSNEYVAIIHKKLSDRIESDDTIYDIIKMTIYFTMFLQSKLLSVKIKKAHLK